MLHISNRHFNSHVDDKASKSGLYRSMSANTQSDSFGRFSGHQSKRRGSIARSRGLVGKRGMSAPLATTPLTVTPVQVVQQQNTAGNGIGISEGSPRAYFSAGQFEKCIVELCYDNILRFRGESPQKERKRASSGYLYANLDTFISGSTDSNRTKTPTAVTNNQDQGGAEANFKRGNGFSISRHASLPKYQTHTKGNDQQSTNMTRHRSLKRTLSLKKVESTNYTLSDELRSTISLEIILEVLTVIVSKAPKNWVSTEMIEVFKQSSGIPIQDLLERLHSKTSQYIMFLILKVSTTWIETSVKFKFRMASENKSENLDPQQSVNSSHLESLWSEVRVNVVSELASHVFLRPQQEEMNTLNRQDQGIQPSTLFQYNVYSIADAQEAFEVLLLAYEKVNQKGEESTGNRDRRSQRAMKRESSLSIPIAPSLSLPPWRKVCLGSRSSKQSRRSLTKTYIKSGISQSRNQPQRALSTLSSEISLIAASMSAISNTNPTLYDNDLSDLIISAGIPHPISAMLQLPTNDLIKNSEDHDDPSKISCSRNTREMTSTEMASLDSQLNSEQNELLVRAAAAAHSYRSTYTLGRTKKESQRIPHGDSSESGANNMLVSHTRDTQSLTSICKEIAINSDYLSKRVAESTMLASEEILTSSSITDFIQLYEPDGSEGSVGIADTIIHSHCIQDQADDTSTIENIQSSVLEMPSRPKIPTRVQSILHAKQLNQSGFECPIDSPSFSPPTARIFQAQRIDEDNHRNLETTRQEILSENVSNAADNGTSRRVWTRPVLLLRRRSSKKTDSSTSPGTSNSNQACYSPPYISQKFKYLGSPPPIRVSETERPLVGSRYSSSNGTYTGLSVATRRRIISKSQDYSRSRNDNRVTNSPDMSSRQTQNEDSIISSAKAKSMPIPLPSPTRNLVRDLTANTPVASEDSSNKLSPGWPSLVWRNPFQPLSPTRISSDFTESLKQRGNLEGSPSPSPTFGSHQGISRKKSIQEKLFGKWSRKQQLSPGSPLASPGLQINGASDRTPSNRSSSASLSEYYRSAASPSFQRDGGAIIRKCEQKFNGDRNQLYGTFDSDEDDNTLSAFPKKRNRDLKSYECTSRQDEAWNHTHYTFEASSGDVQTLQTEYSYSPYKSSQLYNDDGEERRAEDYSDEYEYEQRAREYEGLTVNRKVKELKSDAHIWRVLDHWKSWNRAHSGKN